MGPVEAIKNCFSKYATFRGRARRSEFWWFFVFLVVVGSVLVGVDQLTGLTYGGSTFTVNESSYEVKSGILSSVFWLVTLLPSLAVMARRFHDAGHSGLWVIWTYLLGFVCLIGFVIAIVFWCQKSQPGDTRYGPYPA